MNCIFWSAFCFQDDLKHSGSSTNISSRGNTPPPTITTSTTTTTATTATTSTRSRHERKEVVVVGVLVGTVFFVFRMVQNAVVSIEGGSSNSSSRSKELALGHE